MIIRFSRNPLKVLGAIIRYNAFSLCFFLCTILVAYLGFQVFELKWLYVEIAPVTILGGALAIFLGFRNNAAYDRWWEGRKIWGGIVNYSRSWGMECTSFMDGEKVRELVYRHLAWVYALSLNLRKQKDFSQIQQFLGEEEYQRIIQAANKPTRLVQIQGMEIDKLRRAGRLTDFQHMQLHESLKQLYNLQGMAERIKNTVFPFYYSFYTRVFLWAFLTLLPFALVPLMSWEAIPVCLMVGFVFYILEASGSVTENPFEDRAADVPMTALARTIEIDLRQMLEEDNLPEPALPLKTRFEAEYLK